MTAAAAKARPKTAWSLRRLLLTGILLPVLALIALNAWSLYQQTLASLHTAYDRTLLASAKSISEQIGVTGYDDQAQLRAIVPYSALEIFEADNQSRMFYRVSTLDGQLISGFEELPVWNGRIPQRPPYAALVDFYDDEFRGHPVRVAVLLQPVASADGRGMAVIQVAETLELRESLALQILRDTLIRQALLVLVVALIVIIVVQRATQPIRQLSQDLQGRAQGDLSPLAAPEVPREVQPLLEATNQTMQRLQGLLSNQKRFVRDASHQLRTPLSTLRLRLDRAAELMDGDDPAVDQVDAARDEIDRLQRLVDGLLMLARADGKEHDVVAVDVAAVARDRVESWQPLGGERDVEVLVDAPGIAVAHAVPSAVEQIIDNYVDNALDVVPDGSRILVSVRIEPAGVLIQVDDEGPGLPAEDRERAFDRFWRGRQDGGGSGLGLAVVASLATASGGTVWLDQSPWGGLRACARLPQ